MKKDDIMQYIRQVLMNELAIEVGDVNQQALIRDIGIDSISLMALVVHIENQYSITADELFINYDNDLKFIDLIDFVVKQVEK